MSFLFDMLLATTALSTPDPTPDPPPSGSLNPPSMAFPSSTITSQQATFDDPATFNVSAFETALSNGGVITFGAGTFDISGIAAQTLDGVRIEGAGKDTTILEAGFDPDVETTGSDDVIGIIAGRVELEDLTFKNVRSVLVASGTGPPSGSGYPDTVALQSLASGTSFPRPFNDALACRNIAVKDSGRLMHGEEGASTADGNNTWGGATDAVTGCYFFNCDFTNLWHPFLWKFHGNATDWLIYNCLFRDCGHRAWSSVDGRNACPGWRVHFDTGGLSSGDLSGGKTSDNFRFEHCTFDGIYFNTDVGSKETDAWMYAIRAVNLYQRCWIRDCYFRNIGYDSAGNQKNTSPETSGLFYFKGGAKYERIAVNRFCGGDSGMFNAKPGWMDNAHGIDGSYRLHDVQDLYIRDIEDIPQSNRKDNVGSDFTTKNVFFTSGSLNPRIENFWLETASTSIGIYPQFNMSNENVTLIGSSTMKDWTINGLSANNNAAAIMRCDGASSNHPPDITIDNIKAQITSWAPSMCSLLSTVDPVSTVTITNAQVDVTGAGVGDVTLAEIDGSATMAAEPTGRILGQSGTAYSQEGSGVTNKTLSNQPSEPAGATLDWLFGASTIVGCDRLAAGDDMTDPR